jgi:hypothetical protein
MSTQNFTAAQLAAFDAAYIPGQNPAKLPLFAGTFGQPGEALSALARQQLANQLALHIKVDPIIDALASNNLPSSVMLERMMAGYQVFSYIGEPNPDTATSPPNQNLPGLPPYNATGHTGIVTLMPLPPFVAPPAPPPAPTSLVGPYTGANTAELGIPGPVVKVYEPSQKGLMLPQGFPYTDPNGLGNFLFYIAGDGLIDNSENAVFFLGPQPA